MNHARRIKNEIATRKRQEVLADYARRNTQQPPRWTAIRRRNGQVTGYLEMLWADALGYYITIPGVTGYFDPAQFPPSIAVDGAEYYFTGKHALDASSGVPTGEYEAHVAPGTRVWRTATGEVSND